MSLEQAVMSDPKDPEAIVILGNIALQERRINDAELTFLKAEHLLKDFDKSPMRKGILELQTLSGLTNVDEAHERWKDAQAKLELLLQLSPRDAMVMQRLARALFQQGNAAESLKWLRKSKEVGGPDILTPEAALAKFYEQYGDHRNAVVWMHKALDKAPEDAATQLVAARWALEAGQLDDFETHAVKGLQLATAELQRVPEERSAQVMARLLNAKILRGLAALFRKDYATAEKYFEAARLQSPGNFAATNNLALTLCEQTDEHTGQPDQAKLNRALELVNANYKIDPRNPEINSTLGWVLYRAGMLARAEDALRQAASSGNVSPDTAYYLAQVSYDHDRRNRELAKNLLEAALNTPFFSMRAEAQTLLDKIKAEPPPKAEPLPKAVEKPKNAR
jgi:Flp pilus assembly protein TadD